MGRAAELASDELVVIEILVRQVETVGRVVLLPGFFHSAGWAFFLGAPRAPFADPHLMVAERASVAQGFRHGLLMGNENH